MASDDEQYWHMDTDFLEAPPDAIVSRLIQADARIYNDAQSKLRREIGLYDSGLTLLVTLLQVAQKNCGDWKNDPRMLAFVDLSYSAFNYLLLARHTILLGYYSESQVLLRAIHERVPRCLLFSRDEKRAQQYLRGVNIKQEHVDTELSRLMVDSVQDEALTRLRAWYGHLSAYSHANVEASAFRVGAATPSERTGFQHVGGLLSVKHGRLELWTALAYLQECLEVVGAMIRDKSGAWYRQFDSFKAARERLFKDVMPPDMTEDGQDLRPPE